MNKEEMVRQYAQMYNIHFCEANKRIDEVIAVVKAALEETGSAKFVGFGKLDVRKHKDRISYHPTTKEMYHKESRNYVHFTPGKFLLNAINE